MKTAMQEFIDNVIPMHIIELYDIRQAIKKALEKEKEQLNVSFISGAIEALSYSTPVRDRIKDGYFENKAEQYFEYTYKTNKL